MNSNAFQRAAELFLIARDLPAEKRDELLTKECGGDVELRAEVERLLAAQEKPLPFQTLANQLEGVRQQFDQMPTIGAASPAPGDFIGRYKLLQVIGEGGFGTVYMAEQREPVVRKVALKLIKLGMDTKQVIARFEAERQALAMMDHPNVATVFDAGATDVGRPYFVMELVEGIPITDYCDKHKLPIEQRLNMFAQVCQAVQHAHQKGLIHRDIKPTNILVTTRDDQPFAKVIDFGIAKATQARLTEKTLFTELRQLVGTPEYMSPEQAHGNIDIDTRSDIYSLGVLLYELLTGVTPFDGRELRSKAYGEMQRIIREVDPPAPSTRLSTLDGLPSIAAVRGTEPRKLNSTIRGELDWIVMKALEKDRARRYESAAALAADIKHHLADEPVSAGPPSKIYRARKFVRRNRPAVIGAAIMLFLLIAGIMGTTIGLLEARRQRDQAKHHQKLAQEEAAMASAVARFQSDMLTSADPNRLLGDKVTVLQAVIAAIKELDNGKLSDQPLVEAVVRQAIGNTLSSLGRYDAADPNYRKALELRRRGLGPDHRLIAHSQRSLAMNLQAQGKLAEAEPMFRESLAMFRRVLPGPDPTVARAIAYVTEVTRLQGKFDDAEALAREALEMQRKLPPPENANTEDLLTNLALVLRHQGKHAEAEALFRESLEVRRRNYPPEHPGVARAMGNLGTLLSDTRRHAEAEAMFRDVLSLQRKSLPADHPDLAKTLANLGWELIEQDKAADAEPFFREALSIQQRSVGPNHWISANSRRAIGISLTAQKRFSEAETELLAAEPVLRAGEGVARKRYNGCLKNLAALYTAWDQAEPGQGYDQKARNWQAKLASTQPATTRGTE